MRFIFNIFLILIVSSFLLSCGGLKLKKKASSGEEFLIEKKDPLILPPDFSKLPKPNEQPETVDDDVNIKSIFDGDQTSFCDPNRLSIRDFVKLRVETLTEEINAAH